MFEAVWWEQNWEAVKSLMFYGFWLGLGAMGGYYLAKLMELAAYGMGDLVIMLMIKAKGDKK